MRSIEAGDHYGSFTCADDDAQFEGAGLTTMKGSLDGATSLDRSAVSIVGVFDSGMPPHDALEECLDCAELPDLVVQGRNVSDARR